MVAGGVIMKHRFGKVFGEIVSIKGTKNMIHNNVHKLNTTNIKA